MMTVTIAASVKVSGSNGDFDAEMRYARSNSPPPLPRERFKATEREHRNLLNALTNYTPITER